MITNKNTTEWISTKTDRIVPSHQNLKLWHMFRIFLTFFSQFFIQKTNKYFSKMFYIIKQNYEIC